MNANRGGLMVEWLWDSLLLLFRIFVILSIITVITTILATVYAWWNGDL